MISEQERAYQLLETLCKFKIEYLENRVLWNTLEADIMLALKVNNLEDLCKVNDTVADTLLGFLKERIKDEHTNCTNGTD
jgi:hypothetical protein